MDLQPQPAGRLHQFHRGLQAVVSQLQLLGPVNRRRNHCGEDPDRTAPDGTTAALTFLRPQSVANNACFSTLGRRRILSKWPPCARPRSVPAPPEIQSPRDTGVSSRGALAMDLAVLHGHGLSIRPRRRISRETGVSRENIYIIDLTLNLAHFARSARFSSSVDTWLKSAWNETESVGSCRWKRADESMETSPRLSTRSSTWPPFLRSSVRK